MSDDVSWFFFFKQKTAYEMRISDWSSDVCSSDLPDTAAKMAQPMTLVCSRRPGRRFSQGARPLNRSSDRRVRNRISPIHRNRGRAVSVQLDAAPQMVTAMASPAGRLEKISMPIQAEIGRAHV